MSRETGTWLSSDDDSCRERRAPGSRAMASHVASYGRPALKRQRIGAGLAIRKDPAMKTTALALGLLVSTLSPPVFAAEHHVNGTAMTWALWVGTKSTSGSGGPIIIYWHGTGTNGSEATTGLSMAAQGGCPPGPGQRRRNRESRHRPCDTLEHAIWGVLSVAHRVPDSLGGETFRMVRGCSSFRLRPAPSPLSRRGYVLRLRSPVRPAHESAWYPLARGARLRRVVAT
jgi:hypothetical protein